MANILVVDDEVLMRELLREALGLKGYRVTTVPRVDQALDLLRREAFDLVILDLNIPGASGMTLLKAIRGANNPVPVVVYSGAVTPALEIEARQAGATEVLSKRTGIEQLVEQIGKIVRAAPRLTQTPLVKTPKDVLVVDDQREIRALLQEVLGRKGYRVVEAENGFQAIECVRAAVPSVVLLDVQMPGMDGLATLQELLKIHPTLGVVMATGNHDDETVQKAIALGAYGYVLKPFDLLYLELVVVSRLMLAGQA